MDRNIEIFNSATEYSFSVYLRPGESKEEIIKTHGNIISAVNFLRNRGVSSSNVANLGTTKVKNSNINTTDTVSKTTKTQSTLF